MRAISRLSMEGNYMSDAALRLAIQKGKFNWMAAIADPRKAGKHKLLRLCWEDLPGLRPLRPSEPRRANSVILDAVVTAYPPQKCLWFRAKRLYSRRSWSCHRDSR